MKLSARPLALLEGVGMGVDTWRADVLRVAEGGEPALEALRAECLDGAEGCEAEWREYVSEVNVAASQVTRRASAL